jgi:hypothetical protein
LSAASYTITIGNKGIGSTNTTSGGIGTAGGTSQFGSILSSTGGSGGGFGSVATGIGGGAAGTSTATGYIIIGAGTGNGGNGGNAVESTFFGFSGDNSEIYNLQGVGYELPNTKKVYFSGGGGGGQCGASSAPQGGYPGNGAGGKFGYGGNCPWPSQDDQYPPCNNENGTSAVLYGAGGGGGSEGTGGDGGAGIVMLVFQWPL